MLTVSVILSEVHTKYSGIQQIGIHFALTLGKRVRNFMSRVTLHLHMPATPKMMTYKERNMHRRDIDAFSRHHTRVVR